jgi:hypothetical protein
MSVAVWASKSYMKKIQNNLTRVGFEPTPFWTRTLRPRSAARF